MAQGKHLLIDCRNVGAPLCLDDARFLDAMARAAKRAGANVISQVRYHFGHDSPPGFTAFVLLDESHCSAHCYADERQIAVDIFTCGQTDPHQVWRYLAEELELGAETEIRIAEVPRFDAPSTGEVPEFRLAQTAAAIDS